MPLRLVNIRVPARDDDMLGDIARNNKRPKAELYREAITEYLARYDGRFTMLSYDDLLKKVITLKENQDTLYSLIEKGEPRVFSFPLVVTHDGLKSYGKAIMQRLGFLGPECHEEYATKVGKIDLVAIGKRSELTLSLAIECGSLTHARLMEISSIFDFVLHIPYSLTPDTFPYPTPYQVAYQIWKSKRSLVQNNRPKKALLKKGIIK